MISMIIALIILGVVWYFLQPYIAEPFRKMIIILIILLFVVWLLGLLGIVSLPLVVR